MIKDIIPKLTQKKFTNKSLDSLDKTIMKDRGGVMLKRFLVVLVGVFGIGINGFIVSDSFASDITQNVDTEIQKNENILKQQDQKENINTEQSKNLKNSATKELKNDLNKVLDKGLDKEVKSEPHFDLPKKDAKEQCSFVRSLYTQIGKKTNKKFIVGNLYKPLDLFEFNYKNFDIEKNEITVMDGNHQPYSCFFYYINKKIIGVDCASSGYDEDPAELGDLMSSNQVIRYKNDCMGKINNNGSTTKKIKTNCFVNLDFKKDKLQQNDIIIKDCIGKFYQ